MEHILCIITVVTSAAAAHVVIHCHSMAQCSVNTATAFKLTAIMNFYPLTIVRTSNRIETLQRLLVLLGSFPGNFSTYTHIHDLLASHWQNPKMKRVLRFVFNTFFEGERERELPKYGWTVYGEMYPQNNTFSIAEWFLWVIQRTRNKLNFEIFAMTVCCLHACSKHLKRFVNIRLYVCTYTQSVGFRCDLINDISMKWCVTWHFDFIYIIHSSVINLHWQLLKQ